MEICIITNNIKFKPVTVHCIRPEPYRKDLRYGTVLYRTDTVIFYVYVLLPAALQRTWTRWNSLVRKRLLLATNKCLKWASSTLSLKYAVWEKFVCLLLNAPNHLQTAWNSCQERTIPLSSESTAIAGYTTMSYAGK